MTESESSNPSAAKTRAEYLSVERTQVMRLGDEPAAAPSEDVDALADLIVSFTAEPMWSAVVIARHMLASGWLAAHDAQVRADERRKVLEGGDGL